MTAGLPPLPTVRRTVTARDVVLGATASRDWQPQHHDHHKALAMNLPDIIMNAPTQTGWFHAHALAWAGPAAFLARWRLEMVRPIHPGLTLDLSGEAIREEQARDTGAWLWLDLAMTAATEIHSRMRLLLWRPSGTAGIRPDFSRYPPLDPEIRG